MAELLFYTRFKSQLQRTRPVLMRHLEKTVLKAVTDAQGKPSGERHLIKAVFNEKVIGFWLDMRLLLEVIGDVLDEREDLLYGYAIVLSHGQVENPEQVGRLLSICGGGIFFDKEAAKGMAPYAVIEDSERWFKRKTVKQHKILGFSRLRDFKVFGSEKKTSALVENISLRLAQGPLRSTLLLGPAFSNKRKSLRHYCESLNSDFPSLSICFGRGALNAIIDAYSPKLRSAFFGGEAAQVAAQGSAQVAAQTAAQTAAQEIEILWAELFKERLRDEVTPFFAQKTLVFISKLLDLYYNAATRLKRVPVLLLVDIHLAEKHAEKIIFDIFAGAGGESAGKFFVMGTCQENLSIESLRKWESVFKRIVKTESVKQDGLNLLSLPNEFLEIGYSIFLFGRYYPYGLFQTLMEEEGKNPHMTSKALSYLAAMGVIESEADAEPSIESFLLKAEQILGQKTEPIKAMVIRRLFAWVKRGKISPCFKLITAIKEMDEGVKISDQLLVESIMSDLHRGTFTSLLLADKTWLLKKMTGEERADAVHYILQTSRFLLLGSEQEIHIVFNSDIPECGGYPVLKSQSLLNVSAYHLGSRNIAAAAKTIKEAMMISQDRNNYCLPQLYRLFSLVNLAKQQFGQAADYLGFSMAGAEKSENYYELCISFYYAAAYQFLFGNLSQALQLARKAFDASLKAGRIGWADRARFLEGRLEFETGAYQNAHDIFDDLRKNPLERNSSEKEQVLAAWHYRARVYLQTPLVPKPLAGGADADIFELEAAYMAGDYKRCVELGADLEKSFEKGDKKIDFYFTEQPDWRSGFAQNELMYFSYTDVNVRIISTYRSLSMCRLSEKGKNEAIQTMQNLLRGERFSEIDPWDVFYHYAWYKILEYTKMGQVDISTAISGAFKRLQRRAIRIDDVETRRLYLNQARWNGALCESAKEFKLI